MFLEITDEFLKGTNIYSFVFVGAVSIFLVQYFFKKNETLTNEKIQLIKDANEEVNKAHQERHDENSEKIKSLEDKHANLEEYMKEKLISLIVEQTKVMERTNNLFEQLIKKENEKNI